MATKLKILIATALLVIPSLTFARLDTKTEVKADVSANAKLGVNFCSNVSELSTKILDRLTSSGEKLGGRQEERVGNVSDRQTKRAEELAKERAKADANRQDIYAKLTAKATTDAQKTAVVNFQTTIEAAVKVRRAAVDAAITNYWAALNQALTNRQTQVQAAKQKFVAAMQAAVSKAQTDCANGSNSTTVRASFSASVMAAVKQFNTDRQAVDKFGPQVKALVQTRNQAVKSAFDAFKATAEKARADLKLAFSGTATAQ